MPYFNKQQKKNIKILLEKLTPEQIQEAIRVGIRKGKLIKKHMKGAKKLLAAAQPANEDFPRKGSQNHN